MSSSSLLQRGESGVSTVHTSRHETLQKCEHDSAHFKTVSKRAPADINILKISKFPLSKANHRGVAVVASILISRRNRRVSSLPKNPSAHARVTHVIDTFTSAPADISIWTTPTCS